MEFSLLSVFEPHNQFAQKGLTINTAFTASTAVMIHLGRLITPRPQPFESGCSVRLFRLSTSFKSHPTLDCSCWAATRDARANIFSDSSSKGSVEQRPKTKEIRLPGYIRVRDLIRKTRLDDRIIAAFCRNEGYDFTRDAMNKRAVLSFQECRALLEQQNYVVQYQEGSFYATY